MGIRYEGNFKLITGLYNTSIVTTIAWDSPAAGDLGHHDGFTTFNFTSGVTINGISTGTVFSLESGTLPAGTTLNPATGEITGVLEGTAATYNFTIRVTDNNVSADRAFYMSVDEVTHVSWVSPTAGDLGTAAGGSSYSFTANAYVYYAVGSTVYSVASGTLPAGTLLNAVNGAITGTLTNEASNYSFTIRATNNNTYADRAFTGSVTATTVVSWHGPEAGARGESAGNDTYIFAANTSVIHGVGNTTYSVITGTLPAGTNLDPSSGIISGTLTNTASDYAFTIRATNNGSYADRAFTGSVTATAVVTWNGPTAGAQGASNGGTEYSLTPDVSVVNAVGSTTYSVSAGTLPSGTNLNSSTGEVTGTLTNAGSSYSFTIRATNNGISADRAFAGTVVAVTVVTWNSPAAGALGTSLGNSSYSFTPSITVVNPTGSTVYSVSAGTLPTGTILNSSTGAVTGTLPNTDFDYAFTIRATNNSVASDRAFTGSVAAVVLNWNSPTAGALGASAGGEAYSFISNVSVTSGVGSAGSFAFNGSSRLSVPGGLITGNFAMEAWVKPTSGGSCSIFSDGAYMAGSSLLIFLNGGGVYVNSGSAGGNIVNGVGSTPLDTWSHIAWERIGTTNTIYVNGSAVTTFSYGGQFGASGFAIGSTTAGQYGFFGNISGIRLVTSAIYNGNFSAPTAPPSAITNTVLLLKSTTSGTLLTDSSGLNTTVTNNGTTWSASSPFTPMVFSIPTGTVPAGTSLDTATGIISGTLTNAASDYSFTVRATVNGVTADRSFTGSVTLTTMYAVSPSATSVNEGNAVTFTVTTVGVANATTLYWTNNGTASAADFSDSANSGSFTITNNSGTFTRTLSADALTEGSETIIAQVRTGSVSGTVVATANTVTINDTSVTPTVTYAISPSVASVDEGNSVTYTVTTTGVANATTLYYTNNGTTSAADFSESGAIVLNGSNQYLSVASPATSLIQWYTGSYTLEYWIKPTSFNQGASAQSTVIGNMLWNSTATYWSFGPVTGGTVKLYYWNGSQNALSTSTTIPTNTWTHLALVNNAGTVTIYINGVNSASAAISGSPLSDSPTNLVIGSTNSTFFNGSISNLRITNRALYTANFTPSTVPLTAVANTSLLLKSATSATLVTDSSTNNYTVTNNGTATFNANGPFGDGTSVVINNNTGSFTKIISADVTTEGSETIIMNLRTVSNAGTVVATANTVTVNDTSITPVSTYAISPSVSSVNEGNTVAYTVTTAGAGVSDGTSLYWTNDGTTSAADFTEGGSIKFVSGQTVTVPSNAAFTFGTGDFTVEAWVYINSGQTGVYNIFNVGGAGVGSYGLYWVASSQKFQSGRYGDAAGAGTTTNTYAVGQWYHVANVRSGGTSKLYINGVADSGSTYAMGSVTASTSVSLASSFGGAATNSGYTSNLRVVKGSAVYSANFTPSTTPLTAVTNTALLLNNKSSATALTDSSTNAFTLTNTNTTFDNATPFVGGGLGSIALNGSSQYLTATKTGSWLTSSGNYTVEAWINLSSYSAGFSAVYEGQISSTQYDAAAGWTFGIRGTSTSWTSLRFGPNSAIVTANYTFALNTWYHVAAVNNGGTITLYVNGTSIGTGSNTAFIDRTVLSIGKLNDATTYAGYAYYFPGKISNYRIVNGTAVYTSAFTPSTSPLSAITNTLLLLNATSSTTMLTDSSANNYTITNNGTATFDKLNPFVSTYGSAVFTGAAGQYLGLAGQTQFVMGTGDFTIEAWFNTSSFTQYPPIIDFRPSTTNGAYPVLYIDNTGAMTYMVSSVSVLTKAGMSLNTWTHVAIVRASSVTKMYINGVYTGTSYSDTNNYSVGAGRPIIGQAGYAVNGGIVGNIANLRIVKGTAVYTADFTPSMAPLTAIANTSLLLNASTSGTLATDSSSNNFTITNAGTVTWSPSTPLAQGQTNGSFKVYSNSATITRTLRNDLTTEGSESIILNVRTTSTSGTVVATANTVTVNDTSRGPVTASYLLVAGGGGGAVNSAHGGGAGGLLSGTSALTAGTTYSVVVGTGGLGGVATAGASIASGNSGTNSTFAGLTAIGGGYGGAYNVAGGSGGSGGGGATAGTGTAGQGNNGGTGSATAGNPAGGGGAGAAGGNFSGGTFPTTGTGGAGGAGLASALITTDQATTYSIGQVSGGQVWFAGGGGGCGDTRGANGGAGGLGGGGSGTKVASANGGSGLPASGGGGGGAAYYSTPQGNGGAGGSGVVIISVPTADYSGIVTGAPTVVTNGSNTVVIFKVNGSYTA